MLSEEQVFEVNELVATRIARIRPRSHERGVPARRQGKQVGQRAPSFGGRAGYATIVIS